ncbi:hypothetical protein KKG24_04315 [Patescibacteria group bacterium]|nr:hypothetical protein [Patescibacteria group bacterium]
MRVLTHVEFCDGWGNRMVAPLFLVLNQEKTVIAVESLDGEIWPLDEEGNVAKSDKE